MQRGLLGGLFQRGAGRRSKDKLQSKADDGRIECRNGNLESGKDASLTRSHSSSDIKQSLFTKPEKRMKIQLPLRSAKSASSQTQSSLKRSESFESTTPTDDVESLDRYCDSPTHSTSTMYTSDSNPESETSVTFDLSSDEALNMSLITLEREILSTIASCSSWHAKDPAIDRAKWIAEQSTSVDEHHIIEWEIKSTEIISGWYQGPLFRNAIPHGQGTFFFANGDKYIGLFDMGSMHGKNAVFTEADGSIYRGEFQNNLRHGRGKYLTPRRRYIGDFEHGKPHGQGTQLYLDGSVDFEGRWIFGETSVEVDLNDCVMRSLLEEILDSPSVNNLVASLANQKEDLDLEKLEVEGIVTALAEQKKNFVDEQKEIWEAELEERFQLEIPELVVHSERVEL